MFELRNDTKRQQYNSNFMYIIEGRSNNEFSNLEL